MKLYFDPHSRAQIAKWMLDEAGVDYEIVPTLIQEKAHKKPEYLKINPAGKVPTLVDGALVLTESVAIAVYLAEKYPEKGLLPADVEQRAQVNRWLLFTVTELEQPLWRIARHTAIYPEHQRLPADVAIASREFKEMAAVLEAHMRGREFVVGRSVTVADFVLAYTLDWAGEAELLGDFPCSRAYMERMYARPHAVSRIADAWRAASDAAAAPG